MRVGIIAIQHESNTFLSTPTTLAEFRADRFALGEDIRQIFQDAHHEVGGFFDGLQRNAISAVPLLAAVAVPSGIITAQTEQALIGLMLEQLRQAGDLDGLLVAPHGAAVSENHADMDAYWLSLLRDQLGDDLPIICTLDIHANVSQAMIDACNATVVYRTNPHLDQRQRGIEAAQLMARTLRGEIAPTQALALTRVAINIEKQQTAANPCSELIAFADQMRTRTGVLSNSVVLGFPYADVAEFGSSFIVVTDNNPTLAQHLADELADYLWQKRQDFVAELIDIDTAITMAAQHDGPGCLLDMGDNIGGGSAADGTALAHALVERNGLRSFISLFDPEAVQQAISAGPGQRLTLSMGGKTDQLHGTPLSVEVTVVSQHDGKFKETVPRHGGRSEYDMGATAVVETANGLTLQLTSLRVPPFSLCQLTSCDIDPAKFDIIVAKGVVAPVAAYESVCTQFIRVNTPGSTTADMENLPYQHRRRPLFPFEQ